MISQEYNILSVLFFSQHDPVSSVADPHPSMTIIATIATVSLEVSNLTS